MGQVGQVSSLVLEIARYVMSSALCFVELAFRFQLLVAGQLPSGVFNGTLCLVSGTFRGPCEPPFINWHKTTAGLARPFLVVTYTFVQT